MDEHDGETGALKVELAYSLLVTGGGCGPLARISEHTQGALAGRWQSASRAPRHQPSRSAVSDVSAAEDRERFSMQLTASTRVCNEASEASVESLYKRALATSS